jgi:hypothetical protein
MINIKKVGVVVVLFCVITIAYADDAVSLVRISLDAHESVNTLARRGITIVDAGKGWVHALLSDQELQSIQAEGYAVEVLIDDYQAHKDGIFQRGFYHTYEEVYAVLDSFVTQYPTICRLDTIGHSVQNRPIWAMRVTDYPDSEEYEPEIRLAGNMHGDEHIGTEVTLYFLRFMLENYISNAIVQDLIDNHELWILPTINPDGKVANTRRNANYVDLNRDYGYFWDGWGGSPAPLSQIENKVMRQHLLENNISLEYNYHSAAQYVNYPWDYHNVDPPDSQHIIALSEIYEDSTGLVAINGFDWYQVTGCLQDYTIGTNGALAWTIETLEPPNSAQIDQICYENRDALLEVCRRAGWGMQGIVKDSVTNEPVYARVECTNPERIDIYNDPVLGDFHKMIEPGTYDIRVSANGYAPRSVLNVSVPVTGSVDIGDVLLTEDSTYQYAFSVVLCLYVNHAEQNNSTQPRYALGVEDDVFFSLGQSGYVVLDMGQETPINDAAGDDFTVFEGDDGADEGYTVSLSNTWDVNWVSCGSATGTASFDLAGTGLTTARYVRIQDDGSSSSGPYAGFDLDAIKGLSAGSGIDDLTGHRAALTTKIRSAQPNPFSRQTSICYQLTTYANVELKIYDVTGNLVTVLVSDIQNPGVHTAIWYALDRQGRTVSPGIYFVRYTAYSKNMYHDSFQKVVVIR